MFEPKPQGRGMREKMLQVFEREAFETQGTASAKDLREETGWCVQENSHMVGVE